MPQTQHKNDRLSDSIHDKSKNKSVENTLETELKRKMSQCIINNETSLFKR